MLPPRRRAMMPLILSASDRHATSHVIATTRHATAPRFATAMAYYMLPFHAAAARLRLFYAFHMF